MELTLLASPMFQVILASVVSAVYIDYEAFRQMESWTEFKSYQWQTALFRAFKGAVAGGIAAAASYGIVTVAG